MPDPSLLLATVRWTAAAPAQLSFSDSAIAPFKSLDVQLLTASREVQPSDAEPVAIVLTSTFVLHRAPLGLRVVFYKSGDIVGELRSRGLLKG